jgi:cyclopropane fatty-acyl-phospholipid synthase-like methyltransferase
VQCPICKSSSTYALSKDGRPYFKCSQCEFLFHPKDEKDEGKSCSSFYGRRYWDMERAEALRRENEDGFLRALELLYLSNIQVENILDFGCGLGVTVQLLRDKLDLNAVGVDISADFEKTEYLHKCDLKDLQSIYPSGHFDAIYSVEVFEHVRNPRQILCELKALLKPGGKILLNTATQECIQNYDPEMTYIDPIRRGHVSIYSLKSL